MWLVIMFYFTSSVLNMFRTLIHPPSGACDFPIVSSHWSCVLVSMCVGVSVWLGWGGIRVAGWSLLHGFVTSTDETMPHKYQTLWESSVSRSGSWAAGKIVRSAITVRIRYCSGSQEIIRILWKPPLVHIRKEMKPVHLGLPPVFMIHCVLSRGKDMSYCRSTCNISCI